MKNAMRFIKISFMDGTSVRYSFPLQAGSSAARQVKLEDFFKSRHLVLQAEGRLIVYPIENVKALEFSAGGDSVEGVKLPVHTIRDARPAD